MRAEYLTLQVLLLSFSGWVHRQQQDVVEYLVEENGIGMPVAPSDF